MIFEAGLITSYNLKDLSLALEYPAYMIEVPPLTIHSTN